jgi:hypothetical protein
MAVRQPLPRGLKILAVAASTVMIPSVLDAECWSTYNPVTGLETYTCCGPTTCCTTKWKGSTLVDNTCPQET